MTGSFALDGHAQPQDRGVMMQPSLIRLDIDRVSGLVSAMWQRVCAVELARRSGQDHANAMGRQFALEAR